MSMEEEAEKVHDKLRMEWENYTRIVEQQANLVYHKHVKPFCRERGLHFIAGNGTWVFFKPDKVADHAHTDRLLSIIEKRYSQLWEILRTEIPGMPANDLGSMMPSWRGRTIS